MMPHYRTPPRANAPKRLALIRGALCAVMMLLIADVAGARTMDSLDHLRAKVNHIVVIYQENWSFDALYGHFPGANGIANASSVSLTQVDKNGAPLAAAPLPLNGGKLDPHFTGLNPATPLTPYDLSQYVKPDTQTGDIVHRFYTQQLQIDGGKMDRFVAWSDNGGLVMSYFDAY